MVRPSNLEHSRKTGTVKLRYQVEGPYIRQNTQQSLDQVTTIARSLHRLSRQTSKYTLGALGKGNIRPWNHQAVAHPLIFMNTTLRSAAPQNLKANRLDSD